MSLYKTVNISLFRESTLSYKFVRKGINLLSVNLKHIIRRHNVTLMSQSRSKVIYCIIGLPCYYKRIYRLLETLFQNRNFLSLYSIEKGRKYGIRLSKVCQRLRFPKIRMLFVCLLKRFSMRFIKFFFWYCLV